MILSPNEVSEQDIDYVASHVGSFGDDNRAGIERTLHRISAIRNRQGRIVGLTCRVGRAVYGTIKIINTQPTGIRKYGVNVDTILEIEGKTANP